MIRVGTSISFDTVTEGLDFLIEQHRAYVAQLRDALREAEEMAAALIAARDAVRERESTLQ